MVLVSDCTHIDCERLRKDPLESLVISNIDVNVLKQPHFAKHNDPGPGRRKQYESYFTGLLYTAKEKSNVINQALSKIGPGKSTKWNNLQCINLKQSRNIIESDGPLKLKLQNTASLASSKLAPGYTTKKKLVSTSTCKESTSAVTPQGTSMTIQEEELESLTITSGKTSSKKGWGGQSQSKKQLTITATSACPAKICGKKKK